MNDELKHFGVKGMKWGVRRYQDENGRLTPKGRKRYGEDRYKDYGDGRIEIEKGSELQRILRHEQYAKKSLKGQTYASIGKNDNNFYMNTLSAPGKSRVLKLTANTTLKSPSTDEAASTFFKILRDNPKAMQEYKDCIAVQDEKTFKKDIDEIIKGNMTKKTSNGTQLLEYYYNVNYMFVDESNMPTAKQMFYQELKNKGYNMLRDDHDYYGSGGIIKTPVILLDGESSLTVKTDTIVNKSMTKKAYKYCNEYAKKGEDWAKKFGIT